MTPKEKSQELVAKFRKHAKIGVDDHPVTSRTYNAIQCAIIAVGEILDGYRKVLPSSRKYWEDVLSELRTLA